MRNSSAMSRYAFEFKITTNMFTVIKRGYSATENKKEFRWVDESLAVTIFWCLESFQTICGTLLFNHLLGKPEFYF